MTTSNSLPEIKLLFGRPEKLEDGLNTLVKEGFKPTLMTPYGDYGVCILLERKLT